MASDSGSQHPRPPASAPHTMSTPQETVPAPPRKLQISISPELDHALRMYLANRGLSKKGALSDYFCDLIREELVQWLQQRSSSAVADLMAAHAPKGTPVPAQATVAANKAPPSAPEAPPASSPGQTPTRPTRASQAAAAAVRPPKLTDADLERLVEAAMTWARPAAGRPS